MIRKIINRIFTKNAQAAGEPIDPAEIRPTLVPPSEHGIDKARISSCAQQVTSELQRAGHQAFIVGGAVRDLMLGRTPKDFDVATDATPEEVRALFRRSRIIGRRFQLVHVMCGHETIEVSTFRSSQVAQEGGIDDDTGRILRDNVFGTQAEDALRRDFTVNALYYDPATEEVWDYVNGCADVRARVMRIIGDATTRYREDPVRMLRAVRLAGKLDMQLDAATRAPIGELADLLGNVPSARLFEELLKLLLSGHALQSMHRLREEGLHHGILPMLDAILEQPAGERFVTQALHNTDQRIRQDKPVSPGFLFATLFWQQVLLAWQSRQDEGQRPIPALYEAMDTVLDQATGNLAIPRRFTTITKEIWALQPRYLQRAGSRPYRLLSHPRFRAGFDFLLLRCQSGEIDAELGEWWEEFQQASEERRKAMLKTEEGGGKKRRRRRRKPGSAEGSAAASQEQPE